MSGQPFDRTTIGVREKPISTDHNQEFSTSDRSIRETLMQLLSGSSISGPLSPARPMNGFLADNFQVLASTTPGMSIVVNPGLGFMYNASDLPASIGSPNLEGIDDIAPYKPLVLAGPVSFAVAAAPGSGNSRIDIIEVIYNRHLTDPQTRLQLDPTTKTFGPQSFDKTLSFAMDSSVGTVAAGGGNSTAAVSYKIGTAAGSPSPPATSPGYVKIGEVNVASSTTSITGDQIVDRRALLAPGNTIRCSIAFKILWNSGAPTFTVTDVIAPPSVSFGLLAKNHGGSFQKGFALIHVFGGNIVHATFRCSMAADISSGVPVVTSCSGNGGSTGSLIWTYDNLTQSLESIMAPQPPAVGIGQQIAIGQVDGYALLSGGPSRTDTSLETVYCYAEFDLSY